MAEERESLAQPVWHIPVLVVFTCSAYPFYWFYKNWRDLAEAAAQDSSKPDLAQFANKSCLLRTIGLIVPILNFWLGFGLLKGLASLHPDTGSFPKKHPIAAPLLLLVSITAMEFLAALPGSLYLLSFLVCVPLCVAQSWLNAYWVSVEDPPRLVRHAFSIKELAAIIIGSLWLGLVLAGFFIVPNFNHAH